MGHRNRLQTSSTRSRRQWWVNPPNPRFATAAAAAAAGAAASAAATLKRHVQEGPQIEIEDENDDQQAKHRLGHRPHRWWLFRICVVRQNFALLACTGC